MLENFQYNLHKNRIAEYSEKFWIIAYKNAPYLLGDGHNGESVVALGEALTLGHLLNKYLSLYIKIKTNGENISTFISRKRFETENLALVIGISNSFLIFNKHYNGSFERQIRHLKILVFKEGSHLLTKETNKEVRDLFPTYQPLEWLSKYSPTIYEEGTRLLTSSIKILDSQSDYDRKYNEFTSLINGLNLLFLGTLDLNKQKDVDFWEDNDEKIFSQTKNVPAGNLPKKKLEELKDLFDQGLISEDEYKRLKAKVLGL